MTLTTPGAEQAQETSAHIRILATSDLHMNLNGFDYYADTPDPTVGLTRTASLIRKARQQAEGALVLLFDNGDALQGTPIGDWAAQSDSPHPMMQAFDALGYDAVGLGNHDFGFGLSALERFLAHAACPVLCSNLTQVNGPASWLHSVTLDRIIGQDTPIRIGVLSVLPPQTTSWEAHLLEGAAVAEDILTCARTHAKALRADGCDLVILLAHSGLEQIKARPGLENAVIPLSTIDDIDAIIAGHTHLTLPGPAHQGLAGVEAEQGLVHGTPVAMPGSAGSHLGVIDLHLLKDPGGQWRVTDRKCTLLSASGETEDRELVDLFQPAHLKTRDMMAEPVSQITQNLHSYFSLCAPDRGLALVAAAQAAALRPYLYGSSLGELPVLSAASPSKFGGRAGPRYYTDVRAGEICLRNIADLHVFPNELRAIELSGHHLRDWLEMSAGVFNQIEPNAETELIDSRRAGYNFDVLFGLTYQIDLSRPARFNSDGTLTDTANHRIRSLCLNNDPVTDDQRFIVALNNYRCSGGGDFPFLAQARKIALPAREIKGIVRDYLSDRLPSDPLEHAPYPFSISPMPTARAILRTGPGALAYLTELEGFTPEVMGADADGFQRIRLAL